MLAYSSNRQHELLSPILSRMYIWIIRHQSIVQIEDNQIFYEAQSPPNLEFQEDYLVRINSFLGLKTVDRQKIDNQRNRLSWP